MLSDSPGSCSVGYSETSTLHLSGPTQPRPSAVSSEPILSTCETQTQRHYRVFLRPPQHLHLTERTHMLAVAVITGSVCSWVATVSQKLSAPAFIHSIRGIHEQFAPSGKLAFSFFSKKIWTDIEWHN